MALIEDKTALLVPLRQDKGQKRLSFYLAAYSKCYRSKDKHNTHQPELIHRMTRAKSVISS